MQILYFFEALRTSVFDTIGLAATFFGSETFLLAVLGITYWCVDKELGYRLAFSYTVSGTANNILKMSLRVERPWIRDTSFTPQQEAISTATGYSFPSGHSTNIGVIGTTFLMNCRSLLIKVVAVVLMVLVPLSRVYLGVHSVWDIGAGLALGIIITVIVNKIMKSTLVDVKGLSPIMLLMLLFPLALIIAALAFYYNGLVSYENMADSVKSSGAFFGFIIGWYIERTKVNFNVHCSRGYLQIIKALAGFIIVLAIKYGLKEVFLLIGEEFWPGDFIRYFLMTFFAMGIYPWFIKKFFSSKVPYRR